MTQRIIAPQQLSDWLLFSSHRMDRPSWHFPTILWKPYPTLNEVSMKARRLILGVLGCAAISMAAAPSAQAATIFDFLPPEIASLIPSGSADAVNPLLPPAPAAPAAPAPAPQVAP